MAGTHRFSKKELVTHLLVTPLFACDWGSLGVLKRLLKAKKYVGTKGECLRKYKQYINDEWKGLLEEVYQVCRNQWEYRIPTRESERNQLKTVCQHTLEFENYFLELYRDFLMDELAAENKEHQLQALRDLGAIIFPDQQVLDAVSVHELSEDEHTQQSANLVIDKIQNSIKS